MNYPPSSRKASALVPMLLLAGGALAVPPRETSHGAIATSKAGSSYAPWSFGTDGGAQHYSASAASLTSSQFASAAASGRASLGTGTIGAYGASERSQGYMDISAQGYAEFWDTVTLSATTNYDGFIPLQFKIDGEAGGQGKTTYNIQVHDLDSDRMYYEKWATTTGDVSIDAQIDDIFLSPTEKRRFMVRMYLLADGGLVPFGNFGNSSMADYMNTMHFKWQLPDEVRFTSASGVFNPESIQPVPEPATLAALGLGALGLLRRRATHRSSPAHPRG